MNLKVYENRLIEFNNTENGTQNETNVQVLTIEIPSKYDDFFKKIVFDTPDGAYWDYIENDGSYVIKNNITKYEQVGFYVWLTKTENEETQDFRSKTYQLIFNNNTNVDGEVSPEEETEMERIIGILEEELEEVRDLETTVEGSITETNNLNIDVSKSGTVATVTITKKDGTSESVNILDGEQGPEGPSGKDGVNGADGKDGKDGKDGQNGVTPVRGVDYWTTQDKQEIINDVLNEIQDSEEVDY